MALTKTQQAVWTRARALGGGGQAAELDDDMCAYLVGRIALDLDLERHFPEVAADLAQFFAGPNDALRLASDNPHKMFERLAGLNADGDMYFACLAALHKARLKYETILETQPMPTLEQGGPRGLLQYGILGSGALAAFLIWRKWVFDIDNRAGQETGYLFEPVIANAVGGTPAPASSSPVKRRRDGSKGRQVDCILDRRAYELKIRLTIAASGQGRWREELDFPIDCQASGFTPVLIVLDGTANPKLVELERAFRAAEGEACTGADAWRHLDELAGPTMSCFLQAYIRSPLDQLLSEAPEALPRFAASVRDGNIELAVGGETLLVNRKPSLEGDYDRDEPPGDADGIGASTFGVAGSTPKDSDA